MKIIKFDLPIDGVKVKSIEELQEHFTTEILDHLRSGLLVKWLKSRGMQDKAESVQNLDGAVDREAFKKLASIFEIKIDGQILDALFLDPSGNGSSEFHQSVEAIHHAQEVRQQLDGLIRIIAPLLRGDFIQKIGDSSSDLYYSDRGEIKSALSNLADALIKDGLLVLDVLTPSRCRYGGEKKEYGYVVAVGQKVRKGQTIYGELGDGNIFSSWFSTSISSPCDGVVTELAKVEELAVEEKDLAVTGVKSIYIKEGQVVARIKAEKL